MPSIYAGVPVRLREERERKGMSKQEFADIGGIGVNTQYRLEKRCEVLNLQYIENLHQHGVDTDYILTGVRRTQQVDQTDQIPAQLQPVVGSLVNLWLSCTLDDETIDSWAKMFDRWNPFLNPDAKVFPTRRIERPLDAPKGDATDLSFLKPGHKAHNRE